MKKQLNTLFTLLFCTSFISLSAQTADSVEMGNGYGNDIYYSLQKGEAKKIANNTWDLAFRTGFRTDGIFINSVSSATSQRSTRLFLYPKSDISGWNTFDTAGREGWLEYENSDSSWEFGAFNRAAGTFPDFSWGVYNTVTKVVEGDSLYLIEITNGANTLFKKLQIINKNYGVWHFRYANVDGSNEVVDSIVGSNGAAKQLDYYSIVDEAVVVNHEPDSVKYWDLLFTRYHEFITPPGEYYPVMGVFTNKGVQVAEKRKVDIANYSLTNVQAGDYSLGKNVIGSDWKNFNMNIFQWEIIDSLGYFVKLENGAIWKLVFTGFGGSGNGRSVFNKTELVHALSVNPIAPVASFGVYPNPASTTVSLVFENRSNSVKNTLSIFNVAGQLVETHAIESAPGFYTSTLDISHLPKGVYVMAIENGGHSITQKLIKD